MVVICNGIRANTIEFFFIDKQWELFSHHLGRFFLSFVKMFEVQCAYAIETKNNKTMLHWSSTLNIFFSLSLSFSLFISFLSSLKKKKQLYFVMQFYNGILKKNLDDCYLNLRCRYYFSVHCV